MAKKIAETPLMLQYMEMKKKHPDAILLFRVGDFYETFSDDAIAASEILGITLTRRANGSAQHVELAGFPHHALDTYLPKLVRAGRRVAICEQLEDPKLTKKLVKRGITELVTPGLNTNEASLNASENNYLAGVHFQTTKGKGGEKILRVGVSFLDITTGEFLVAEGSAEYVDKLLNSVRPAEVLRQRGTANLYDSAVTYKATVNELEDWVYKSETAMERLTRQFSTRDLKGYGVQEMPLAVIAAGSIMSYLDLTNHTNLSHLTSISRIDEGKFMRLDPFTMRSLELIYPMMEGGVPLVRILDRTLTRHGARELRKWICFPLLDVEKIRARQNAVEYFFRDVECRDRCGEALSGMGDFERTLGSIANARGGHKELLDLQLSIEKAMEVREILSASDSEEFRSMGADMPDVAEIAASIKRTLTSTPVGRLQKSGFIAPGVSPELDELRAISSNSRQALEAIRQRESERTGITSLKIGFNNVFGYYIEVTNTHRDKVPQEWIRKQTLTNAERYITEELKELEDKIINAQGRIEVIEAQIMAGLKEYVQRHIAPLQKASAATAKVDCLLSMATVASMYGYVRPVVDDSEVIEIREGRHPVIERMLPPGEPYISNSVTLDPERQQIMMITGPNMSGKSALLRQTALITLMAQTGSFVPAESARIGMVDKIFTRVGASDSIATGESTFMLEMTEASAILNNMGPRSLILFDELGRGTSTYDGISIAWSIVEHIHENGRCRPKTLFATHYHELNEMEKSFPRIANYNVSVKEMGGKVVFLRKLARGGSEHSFGIHVAKLAGMPPSIVKRAEQVLVELEKGAREGDTEKKGGKVKADTVSKQAMEGLGKNRDGYQLSFFQLDDPLLSQIRDRLLTLDIDNLTPIQSLQTLHDLQSLLKGK